MFNRRPRQPTPQRVAIPREPARLVVTGGPRDVLTPTPGYGPDDLTFAGFYELHKFWRVADGAIWREERHPTNQREIEVLREGRRTIVVAEGYEQKPGPWGESHPFPTRTFLLASVTDEEWLAIRTADARTRWLDEHPESRELRTLPIEARPLSALLELVRWEERTGLGAAAIHGGRLVLGGSLALQAHEFAALEPLVVAALEGKPISCSFTGCDGVAEHLAPVAAPVCVEHATAVLRAESVPDDVLERIERADAAAAA